MLRRIGLSNFKCWKELAIELAPITLLFGANSSGKSAVLQSLLMLKQTVASRDPNTHLNFGGGPRDYVDLGSYHDLVSGHDNEHKIDIQLNWTTSGSFPFASHKHGQGLKIETVSIESVAYEAVWGFDASIYLDLLRYRMCLVGGREDWVEIHREAGEQYRLLDSKSEYVQEPDYSYLPDRSYRVRWLPGSESNLTLYPDYDRFSQEFDLLVSELHYSAPLRQFPKRHYLWTGGQPSIIEPDGANAIEMLIASVREDGGLLHDVRDRLRALDLADNFNVKPVDENQRLYEATVTIGGVESSVADVGFGVSQVLPIITMLLSAPEGSIILLEQPELHLHPNAQAGLADLMLLVAERRKLQLIVESHSEHIVRRLQRRIAEAEPAFAQPANIKMYYCQPGAGGSEIAEVDLDRFGQISNWPEKFLGDISGDIHSMARAAIKRRRQEIELVGSGS